MGTRNLICVVKDGEYKVAQYGQWDGGPSGQGSDCVDFILGEGNLEKLKGNLSKIRFLDREGKDKDFLEEYNKNTPEYIGDPDFRTPEQVYWWSNYMSRDLGADILSSISKSTDDEILIDTRASFAKDSLFCEWAYVLNLDSDELEIFQGFNTSKLDESERFYFEETPEEYYPVRLLKKFKFSELTDKTMGELIIEDEDE